MLVYGDAARHEVAAEKLEGVRATLQRVSTSAPGLGRHSLLIAALIDAGELAQGLADARAAAGSASEDHDSAALDATMTLVTGIAGRCALSWSSGFADAGTLPQAELERCAALVPTDRIEVRQPEGYAFYALYPESYLEAARRCAGGSWQVIGIRSIGTSLAAIAAAALGAAPPTTVRPIGHPFERHLASDREIEIDRDADAYAIVDEGPGLSGSSIAAVADVLLRALVPIERLHLFPSHANGPGPQASASTRSRWERAQQHVVSFDAVILNAVQPAHRLDSWVTGLVGPLTAPLRDIGAGAWRRLQRHDDAALPPTHPWQERRKFLAEANDCRWLVKFAGLGHAGELKLERARSLADAGFTAQPVGLCHGFLVERWRDDLVPLPQHLPDALRARLVERIADYLAFRARSFAAAAQSGASIEALEAMARHNTEAALGVDLAARWDRWRPHLRALAATVHRVETDNRMQRWEWLVGGDSILKTDALDHHAGHDLIGCQDIAWDIVGAATEFDLTDLEERQLIERVADASNRLVDAALVRFLRPCYLAFQLGYWHLAQPASADAEETRRVRSTIERYAAALREAL